MATLILGAAHATRSNTMREIVRRGVSAVPILLKHINDNRTTKIPPVAGMMWMDFSDEYDFNRRTRTSAPAGVNRHHSRKDQPKSHTITVGDLCFVALGQIVNREYSATRYQPTGGLIVSSPTFSQELRKVVVEDWRTLTAESHRRLLIEDILKPDHEYRRSGAYLRLAFYYPETVEDLVLKVLSRPTFDVFSIEEFCRNGLYKVDEKKERKAAYERFLQKQGDAFAPGVEQQLFDDLDSQDRFGSRPRELLIQLFAQPASVKAADRPALNLVSLTEQARFVATLIHDDSRKIGDVVKGLFLKNSNDDYFAPACLRCLASRGYADFLLEQLEKINPADTKGKHLHEEYIKAISTSKALPVRAKLFDILRQSANEAYFMAALPANDRTQDRVIADAARKLLARLPEDTKDGRELLEMIGERFPNEAKAVYRSFLAKRSANRAETICCVLWYGHPLSKEILAPLLDDKRELSGFTIPMRVCDRAAEAISHTSKDNPFDSDWGVKRKDEQIAKLKQYCKESAP